MFQMIHTEMFVAKPINMHILCIFVAAYEARDNSQVDSTLPKGLVANQVRPDILM